MSSSAVAFWAQSVVVGCVFEALPNPKIVTFFAMVVRSTKLGRLLDFELRTEPSDSLALRSRRSLTVSASKGFLKGMLNMI